MCNQFIKLIVCEPVYLFHHTARSLSIIPHKKQKFSTYLRVILKVKKSVKVVLHKYSYVKRRIECLCALFKILFRGLILTIRVIMIIKA